MQDLRRRLGSLRRGERGLAGLLVLTYALALCGLYLLKPARDSYFLSVLSAADLPLAFVLSAALAVPVSVAYSRASRRWALGRLLAASIALLVVGLLAWRWLLPGQWPVVAYLFYAWVAVAGGLITAQFWLVGNAVCDARQAKRLFPLLSLAGILGAVAGGWLASWLAGHGGSGVLLLVLACAGIWTAVGLLSALILRRRRSLAEPPPPRRHRVAHPMRQFGRDLGGSQHLRLIVGLVSVSVVVSTFVDFQFKTVAAAAHPQQGDLLAYLGGFYARMNLLALALQLLLTSRLLRSLGVGGAVLVLPAVLTVGLGGLLMVPLLPVAATVRASEMGLKYSLDKTSRELLFLPLPLGLKRRVKVFLDTFVERGARGLAGLLLWLCTAALGLSLRGTVVVALLLVVVWALLAIRLRRQYVASFRRAVARRELDREDLRTSLRDPGAVATLAAALRSPSPREVAYALAMLRSVPREDLPAGVVDCLGHEDAAVRQRAVALAVEASLPGLGDRVRPLLADPEPDTGRLAAAYLHADGGEAELRAALELEPDARASVLDYLARRPATEEVPLLLPPAEVPGALAAPSATLRHRAALAEYLGRTWSGTLDGLQVLLAGQPTAVVGPALVGLGRQGDRTHLEPLAGLLAHRELRRWARRALTAYGPVAVPTLMAVATRSGCTDAARGAALRGLARLPYQRTVDLILEHADTGAGAVRAGLIPVLLRLRERRPSLHFPARSVERLLGRETAAARRLLDLESRLGPADDTAAERLLRRCLAESRRARLARSFQLLALRYDVRDIMGAWLRWSGPDRSRRADALEFLENLLTPRHRVLLQGLLAGERPRRRPARRAALRELIRGDQPWLAACAARALKPTDLPPLRKDLRDLAEAGPPVAAETARLVLDSGERTRTMLTTIEKAILLEGVEHFDAVDSERLAAIAAIATEATFGAGDVIFRAGDGGDAMYLVVDGEVILRRGTQEIARTGPREVFGVWALFEPEPRMVDAVAAGDCRLLRIDRNDVADLMAEDITVAQSLLLSVARRLRQLAARAV